MASERGLARLFELGSVAGMTDGQLLDQFTSRRGKPAELAFEALVARHGPMVARVCRSCLRAEHDVEDAFQATFLVLVRRAGSIGVSDRLGPWLYGVAHRVARKARAVAARRRGREGDSAGIDPPARADSTPDLRLDLAPVLHEEVNRLPSKYREPVILCHLQGLTHAEAARELAWPVGTVSVRLARARKLLADRLVRRGVSASAALVTTALAAEATAATSALVPSWIPPLTAAATAAATGLTLAATPAALSAGAAALARRTSMTLLFAPLKWLAAPAVALATVTGAALVGSTGPGDTPQTPAPPTPAAVTPAPAALPEIQAAGNVRLRRQGPVRAIDADNLVIHGTVAELDKTVKQLTESNPRATFRLFVEGGGLVFVGASDQKVVTSDLATYGPFGQLSHPSPFTTPTAGNPAVAGTANPGSVTPDLALDLTGDFDPVTRQTTYAVKVTNQQVTPVEGVSIFVSLPREGGKLLPGYLPAEGKFLSKERMVLWNFSRLAGGETINCQFVYANTVAGSYRCLLKAVTGSFEEVKEVLTEVPEANDLTLKLTQTHRSIPVGKTTYYDLAIKNNGVGEALQLRLSGELTNLKVVRAYQGESVGEVAFNLPTDDHPGGFLFPAIPRLAAGESITLSLEVEGLLPGRAGASASLAYDLPNNRRGARVEGTITTTVTDDARAKPAPKVSGDAPSKEGRIPPKTEPTVVERADGTLELGPVPPGYFDLPVPDPSKPGSPRPVKIGQMLNVEVLEALPGRPISGYRLVRDDGTISLGFYGDVYVVGLNRDQIKVKVVVQLRTFLSDDLLGLIAYRDGKPIAIPPLKTNRVFVDDQPGPLPIALDPIDALPGPAAPAQPAQSNTPIRVGQWLNVRVMHALPGRPINGERLVRVDGTISLGFYGDVAVAGLTCDQAKVKVIDMLRPKLDDWHLGLLEEDGQLRERKVPPAESARVSVAVFVPPTSRPVASTELVEKLSGQVSDLSGKLDRALGAIEQLRRDKAVQTER